MLLSSRVACIGICAGVALLALPVVPRAAEPSEIPAPQKLEERRNVEKVADALWTHCLKDGRQVVLDPREKWPWTCTEPSDGEKLLAKIDPEKFDPDLVCQGDDMRRMPTGLIHNLADKIKKHLAEKIKGPDDKSAKIQRNGIRIIGAVFCSDEVNLTDLDMSHPLTLDRGLFRFGIRARNLTIGGNFSVAASYVYSNFDISDSKFGGTLFGRNAFIRKARITDTQVRDFMRFNNSTLLEYFVLSHVKVGRGVDLSQARISTMSIRRTDVAERLDLSNSEASCRYHIEKSDLNELRAIGAGFGTLIVPKAEPKPYGDPISEKPIKLTRRVWTKTQSPEMQKVPAVKKLIDGAEDCADTTAQFGVLEGTTLRSVCLLNFRWVRPAEGGIVAPTMVAFNGTTVTGNMTLNLWPEDTAADPKGGTDADRMLQFVGTKIGALFFDFKDNERSYRTSIDQIGIDRIYASDGGCATNSDERLWRLPDPANVADWLAKNNKSTLQTYSAFIKAFENAGADTTDLKIAKARLEFDRSYKERRGLIATAWHQKPVMQFVAEDGPHAVADYVAFGVKGTLGVLADYGFRPAQVIWAIVAIVPLSWLMFRLLLQVVAFDHERKPGMLSVGWTFVFDRLLPVYRLRDEHYDIGRFYQRGSGLYSRKIRYFGRDIRCVPASRWRTRLAQIYLDVLKAVGIILAAFLVAAINALIAR